jgi:hypothetical protein
MTEAMPLIRRLRRVVPLALVVVVAAACGDNDKGSAAPKTPPPPGTTTLLTGTRPPSAIGGGKPKLVIGKRSLLPLLQSDLSRFVPAQVEGTSLKVVALAGPDALWAGRSSKQRILVTMRLKGNEPPKITLGQKVDFIGILTALPADAGALGVRNGGDTTLLEKQGAYVSASVADVKLR